MPRFDNIPDSQDGQFGDYYVQPDDVEDEDIRTMLNSSGAQMCEAHLESIYDRDDKEDLEAGLLDGDALDQDSSEPRAQGHFRQPHNDDYPNGLEEPEIETEGGST
ncbi:unnamed protein product [Rotaria sordida]|uniref:Uncharacterized protein n=1 Tax=Rotaria sordida TaxID=392033 RepID=A0A819LHP6_9BILA|nr:unnamed protein product [Rotaria sordida]CAF1247225.1 unnamed protein product [Rotaria sordida]CAF3962189.1 unnamed protein product [Rotaria sordida]CAF4054331.1 unnamed protein product [Rotaria sordida]